MQLGRYKILKQLATGSVAEVLLARASGLEGFARHVVIKRIRPELASEDKFVRGFLDEARIAGSLHHQHVVQVHDVGEQDGAYYFAMEYVHGEDVRRLISRVRERGEQVPLEHVIAIVTATAAGLHYAHEQVSPTGEPLELVHRDVSPANILIGYDGSVKIVDFGLARAALRSETTATGTLKGKASYMSPEQCTGRAIDRRTDIFSLGIVLFELATAQRLFNGPNEFMTMAAIVEGEIPRPSSLRAEIPPALDEIILRALARAPESRYQSAEALRESLEAFAVAQELRTSPKALADYLVSLFGQRPEPWQLDGDAEPVEPEPTQTKGLVTASELDEQALIARHAPRAKSPLVLAQTDAQMEWSDEDEQAATVGRGKTLQPPTPTPPLARDRRPTMNERPPGGESDGETVVQAPMFVAAEELPAGKDDDDGLDEEPPTVTSIAHAYAQAPGPPLEPPQAAPPEPPQAAPPEPPPVRAERPHTGDIAPQPRALPRVVIPPRAGSSGVHRADATPAPSVPRADATPARGVARADATPVPGVPPASAAPTPAITAADTSAPPPAQAPQDARAPFGPPPSIDGYDPAAFAADTLANPGDLAKLRESTDIYVGPPAPPPGLAPRITRLAANHRIVVIASSALVATVAILLVARACTDHTPNVIPATAPDAGELPDAGIVVDAAVDAPAPTRKSPVRKKPKRKASRGRARGGTSR